MREIESTLFRSAMLAMSRWTKLSMLMLLGLCFIGLQSADAQIVHPVGPGGKTLQPAKINAGDNIEYTDDNTNDGLLYSDFQIDKNGKVLTSMRSDTVELCPQDEWHHVYVTFTEFDIHPSDVLKVFDNDLKTTGAGGLTPQMLFGSGVSNPNAGGGWVAANCSPDVNESGCLTFVFETDANNTKGLGWEAWVTARDRGIEVKPNGLNSKKLVCGPDASMDVEIPVPTLEADCDPAFDAELTLRIRRANGTLCRTETYTGLADAMADVASRTINLGVGVYTFEWFLTNDPVKTTGRQTFSISLPALVCNDEIVVPLGSACAAEVVLDDVVENPCLQPYLDYAITVTLGKGKDAVITGSGSSVNAWPIVTRQMLKDLAAATGEDLTCGGTATVKITRIYTPDGMADCDNGVQTTSCETILRFKDETAPVPVLTANINNVGRIDTFIACDEESLRKVLRVSAIDNCDVESTSIGIVLEEKDPCFDNNGSGDTTRAFVTGTAIDICGNVGRVRDTFLIIRPASFAFKTQETFECGESEQATQSPGLEVGYIKGGNEVITDTIFQLSEEDYFCGYILKSRDLGNDIPDTDCGTKDFIEWAVLDWCNPEVGISVIDTQFIEYIDTQKPLFVDTMSTRQTLVVAGGGSGNDIKGVKQIATDAKVSLGHFECTFDANTLPKPAAVDMCDDNPTVTLIDVLWVKENGEIDNRSPQPSASALICGDYYLLWRVDDACHEQPDFDLAYQFLSVVDDTKPSAACVDQLNVSVPNEKGARITAEDVDAGSFDACGIASRLIRIKGSGDAWAEFVDIGCEYVHPDLQIELQVIDEKGNENICWLDILVEDKIPPVCQPLDDIVADCDKYHNGELGASTDADEDKTMESSEWTALEGELLALYNQEFGNPICEDNLKGGKCGELVYEQQYQLIQKPCGEIRARRRYRAQDWSGLNSAWVEQKITINYKANWKVTFPADWEGECGDMAPAESIIIENGACDLLGYEVTEKQFDIPGDACYKIERTYHVINWCKYTAGDEPIELGRIEGEHGFSEGLMLTSLGNEDNGYWTYIQVLKVHDDEGPTVTIINPEPCISGIDFDAIPYGEEDVTPGASPFECDEPKTWSAIAVDCSSNISWIGRLFNAETGEMVLEVETNELTYVVSNKETYFAEFWAYDNCGNSGGEKGDPVKFWDCKKPTPYVLNGIAIEMMQTGMVQVWATDLDQNSFDNCTDQAKLDMRIWADFLGDAPTTLEGVQALSPVITFQCDRVGTNVVYIYVIDEEGNYDFAQTYVIVQDNMNACEGAVEGGMVAGTIVNPQGENVESVQVAITGAAQQTATTGAEGAFQFTVEAGADYTVTPTKDINPLNGVSTFDLVLISKHILGITPFDSPYKYIAADVNKSGSITAFDMVQLRQLILNITTEFPGNDSWRFVDASYEFTSANAAAENFSEFYTINALEGNMANLDFVGVKIGDVNGNAKANSLLGAETRSTNGALTLTTADRFVEAGETVTVAFNAPEIANAQGYQFTMNFAGQNAQIGEGIAKAANFNTVMAQRGVITTSWNGEATANDVLFTMTFDATASGLLSELVSVTSDITTAEAYNAAGDLLDVNLAFAATAAAGFELGQNTPNPFNGETLIGFNLPVAGSATLTVMDAQGKVLKAITADYAKGANQVTLNANELGATGVLYYQLESADNVATKKMIIIE